VEGHSFRAPFDLVVAGKGRRSSPYLDSLAAVKEKGFRASFHLVQAQESNCSLASTGSEVAAKQNYYLEVGQLSTKVSVSLNMTWHWEYLVPVCPSSMGYSVSITEKSEDEGGLVMYDLNNDGSCCDVYVMDNTEVSLIVLMHLRTFVKQKGGYIYCERINASRGRPPSQYDFYGSVIVWTNKRAYRTWNHINDVINHYIKKDNYDVVTQNRETLWSFFHCGWSVKSGLVESKISESITTRYIDGWMMYNPSYVDLDFNPEYVYNAEQEKKCVDWLDPFRILKIRVPDSYCTVREKSTLESSDKELTRTLTVKENTNNNTEIKFVVFVFWPQRKISY
jgi:hypothetical protein